MGDRENALRITGELRREMTRIYAERLRGGYLYGSYARDEATEDSDIDVAVILSGALNRPDESRRVSGLVSEICLRETALISILFLTEGEWVDRSCAIYRNIIREGISA